MLGFGWTRLAWVLHVAKVEFDSLERGLFSMVGKFVIDSIHLHSGFAVFAVNQCSPGMPCCSLAVSVPRN